MAAFDRTVELAKRQLPRAFTIGGGLPYSGGGGEIEGRVIGGKYRFRKIDLDRFFEDAPRNWDFKVKDEHGD